MVNINNNVDVDSSALKRNKLLGTNLFSYLSSGTGRSRPRPTVLARCGYSGISQLCYIVPLFPIEPFSIKLPQQCRPILKSLLSSKAVITILSLANGKLNASSPRPVHPHSLRDATNTRLHSPPSSIPFSLLITRTKKPLFPPFLANAVAALTSSSPSSSPSLHLAFAP